jgi:hypothetical protein
MTFLHIILVLMHYFWDNEGVDVSHYVIAYFLA